MRFLTLASIIGTVVCQDCTFPSTLLGDWTTTNLGAITIGSGTPSMTTELTLTGAAGTIDFNCRLTVGNIYVLQSTATISVFSGTTNLYAYMCMDLRQATGVSYYFYMNSEQEVGFGGMRMKGLATNTTTFAEVCTITIPVEEFHTMVKVGMENTAIDSVQCPDNLLGEFQYTYTDNTGTYCENVNTSTINSCNSQNLTTIQVNNTGCTETTPFYSSMGVLGCLFSVYSSDTETYYTALYNLDSTISNPTTYQFICVASKLNASDSQGTVHVSMLPTECTNGTVTTTLPTGGALMVLVPNCVPIDDDDESYKWLIPVLLVLAFFIVLVIVGICLYMRHRKFMKNKAREKKALVGEEHPLGEVSISLDAPASLERMAVPYDDTGRMDTFRTPRTPRSKRKSGMSNPLSESSLHLDFKGRSWSTFHSGKGLDAPNMDPFTEMDNGMIVPMSQQSSRAAKSMMNKKQKSFIFDGREKTMPNGSANRHLPITDGREAYPDFENPDFAETLTARSVKSMNTVYRLNGTIVNKAPSVAARSVKARSVKAPSIANRSVKAKSIKAPSIKARSIKAPSVKALSMKAPSVSGATVKSRAISEKSNSPRKLTRSATTTRLGSVTKRVPSTRKKDLSRSKTMTLPSNAEPESTDHIEDFINGEMAVSKAPSESGRSRYSQRTGVSNAPSKTPRRKAAKSMVKLPALMTDEEKIEEVMKTNSSLVRGTVNPSDVRRDSFFNQKSNLSRSVLKPHASKKPWKG